MSEQERRYGEDEVRRIFAEAAEGDADPSRDAGSAHAVTPASPVAGLTLAQLKEIGTEVGLSSALVERAAMGLDRAGTGGIDRRTLGVPVTVTHQEILPNDLSDEAWDRLVVEIREVFKAAGSTSRDGSLRQWRNGNLAVFAEPTADGTRIRMQTTNADVTGRLMSGAGTAAIGGALVPLIAFSEQAGRGMYLPAFFLVLMGLLVFFSGFRIGPSWADERLEQMRHIAGRAIALSGESDEGPSGESP